ncbi:MAG: hypothetical protein NC131_12580, partial [Roseburia sp.]|nr:hypothetical protein [Roseburia sp.]
DGTNTVPNTLSLQREDYPTGIEDFQVAYVVRKDGVDNKPVAPSGRNPGVGGDNWKSLAAQTAYDGAGNPFTYYMMSIGNDARYIELDVSTMNRGNSVSLGYNRGGVLDESYKSSGTNAVDSYNSRGANTQGTGRFVIDLDQLIWLDRRTATNKGETVDFRNASFKEAYVDVIVSGVDGTGAANGVQRTYTLHLLRVNDDDTLRMLQVTTTVDGTVNRYDNALDTPDELGEWTKTKDTDGKTDVYRVMIDESYDRAAITVRATDDAAMTTLSKPGEGAKDPVKSDSYIASLKNVALVDEITRFEVKVRAEDSDEGYYSTSYLEVFRTSSDAGLKEVLLNYSFADGKGAAVPMSVKGVFQNDASTDPNSTFGGTYRFVMSTKEDTLAIKNATLLAIANRQTSQVTIGDKDNKTLAAMALGQNSIDRQTITTTSTGGSEYLVTVKSSNGKVTRTYKMEFIVVDLELDTLNVDGADALSNYYIESIDGVNQVVYYAVVDEYAQAVELEVQTHNNHKRPENLANPQNASILKMSDLDSTVADPIKPGVSAEYRQSQLLAEGPRSQFQIKVGNYADPNAPVDPTTNPNLVSTKYLRVYRNSSETGMQSVTVYYKDKNTGAIIAVPAKLNAETSEYVAYVPDYVNVADIELIGPSDLSYVQLTPGMTDKVRKEYTVKDAPTPAIKNVFDLKVTAIDGTVGDYDVVIYKEDAGLARVEVDGVAATLREEGVKKFEGDTEHKLYEALAFKKVQDNKADVYVEANSNQALLSVDLTRNDPPKPTSETASSYTYRYGADGEPVETDIALTYGETNGIPYEEVTIHSKANPGVTFNDETAYLRIYKATSDVDIVKWTMTYTDDLGNENQSATVYQTGPDTDFTVVLPSTAVDAKLTATAKHPLSAMTATLAGKTVETIEDGQWVTRTEKGIYALEITDVVEELTLAGKDVTYTVTSTDGKYTKTYTVHIVFVDLAIKTLTVGDHYDPAARTNDPAKVHNTVTPVMTYETLMGEKVRYYDQSLVGDKTYGLYSGEITLDYMVEARLSDETKTTGRIIAKVDDGAYEPELLYAAPQLPMNGKSLADGKDIQRMDVRVYGSTTLRVFDPNTKSYKGTEVTYAADYVLNTYRFSSNADVKEVRFDYEDGGVDESQYGVFAREVKDGANSYDDTSFILYIPVDRNEGKLTITAASEGAQLHLSTDPITADIHSISYSRGQVVLDKAQLEEGDTLYLLVFSSNNLVPKYYTINVHTLNMDLQSASVTPTNTYTDPQVGTAATVTGAADNTLLTRKGETVDTYTDAAGKPAGTGKKVNLYEARVPNYTTDNAGTDGAKRYLDDIKTAIELTAKASDKTTLAVFNADGTAATAADGSWKVELVDYEEATLVRVTLSGAVYAANGEGDESYGHKSEMLERVHYLKIVRVDKDTTLDGNQFYAWMEDKEETNGLNAGSTHTLPEAAVQFRVEATANSQNAKVDVRIYDAASYDASKIDFTGLTRSANVSLNVPKLADGSYATKFQVVITVLASDGETRGSYIYDMERVVKSLEKAGDSLGGMSNLSDVAEYLDMAGYIANLATDKTPAQPKADGQRVIVAVTDLTKFENAASAPMSISAVGMSGFDSLVITTLDGNDRTGFQRSPVTTAAPIDLLPSRDSEGSLYAKVGIQGVERVLANSYNTEYIKFVQWSADASLKSVTVKYTLNGAEFEAEAYQETANGPYVVYLPSVVTEADDVTATTVETYANVKLIKDTDTGYRRHTVSYGAMDLDNAAGKTVVNIRVVPSVDYYDEANGVDYTLEIRPADMAVTKAEFNWKPADGQSYNLKNIPASTNPAKVNTFEGKIQAIYDESELLAVSISGGDRVKFGYIKTPSEPTVTRESDTEGLWRIYDELLAVYESVSKNFLESYTGITWVDYDVFTSYSAYKGYVDGGGEADGVTAKGLEYTGWIEATASADTAVNGKFLSALTGEDHVDISKLADSTTMVKVLVGKGVLNAKDNKTYVQSYVTYNTVVTRENDNGDDLKLFALAQGTGAAVPAKADLDEQTPVSTQTTGDTTTYTYNYTITAATDDIFNLWLDTVNTAGPTDVVIEAFRTEADGSLSTTPAFTWNLAGSADGKAAINANNRLPISVITDQWNANKDLPNALVVRVTATAESGSKSVHNINVYRQSSDASLDMVRENGDKTDPATTVAGELATNPTAAPGADGTITYKFNVSTTDFTILPDGTYTIPVDLYTVVNVLGNREGVITLADGRTFRGTSGVVDVPAAYTVNPLPGRPDRASITLSVTSEDGSVTRNYVFDLTVTSGDTGVKEILITENITSYGTEAEVLVSGTPTGLVRKGSEIKAEYDTAQAEYDAIKDDPSVEEWQKVELESKLNKLEEQLKYYYLRDSKGNLIDEDGNPLAAGAEPVLVDRTVWYGFLSESGALRRSEYTTNESYAVRITAKATSSQVGMDAYKSIYTDAEANYKPNWRLSYQTSNYKTVNLYQEMYYNKDGISELYNEAYRYSRDYPQFPEELAVDNIYFAVQAADGSVQYYVLEMRNSDNGNRNLDYIQKTDENEEKDPGFALWAYATGVEGVEDGTLAPNATIQYRTASGGRTNDPYQAMSMTAIDLVDRYGHRAGMVSDPTPELTNIPLPYTFAMEDKDGKPADFDLNRMAAKEIFPVLQAVYGEADASGKRSIEGYRLMPTYFTAMVDSNATSIQVRAVAEHKFSAVAIQSGTARPTFPQSDGERSVTITGLTAGQDSEVYIYIRNQAEQKTMGSDPSNWGQRYTLMLVRADENRNLNSVFIVGDEAGLNETSDNLVNDDTAKTKTVEGTVAAASEQVSLSIRTQNRNAYITLYSLDENGQFDKPMEFFIPMNYYSGGNYAYDSATDSYIEVTHGTGTHRRVSQVQGSLGTTYVEVGAGQGDYALNAATGLYDRVGDGLGTHIRCDITVPFNITDESVPYGIRVESLMVGDMAPTDYTLVLRHRDNALRLGSVIMNTNRKGDFISGATVKLVVNEADGSVSVAGAMVDQVIASTAQANADRVRMQAELGIKPGDPEYDDTVNTVNTDLIPAGSIIRASYTGHSVGEGSGAARDGIVYFYEMLGSAMSEYAAMSYEDAELFRVNLPANAGGAGQLRAI